MVWPFKSRSSTERCPPIGQYRIDTSINGLQGVTPLSAEELAALNPDVTFEKGQVVHAPQAHFMDLHWDTILGVVAGDIYKVSAQWTGPRAEVGKAARQLIVYCTKHYGKGKGTGKNMTLWDCSDGNVVLASNNFGDQAMLNVFVTSAKVRQYKRI
jgi:hypothetical protein